MSQSIYNIVIDKITYNLTSLIRGFLKKNHAWLLVLAFAIFMLLAANALAYNAFSSYSPYGDKVFYSFGGPTYSSEGSQSSSVSDISASLMSSLGEVDGGELNKNKLIFANGASSLGNAGPFSNVIPTRDGLLKYKVQEGDTLSEVAAQFGVSIETLKFANSGVGSLISPGDELIILPVSGILYEVKQGDTLESVSTEYKINSELVKKFNDDYQKAFEVPGKTIILPYAKPQGTSAGLSGSALPKLNNYFARPANGWSWGELHFNNAIDIAAGCGEPIYAAAEGLVVESYENGLWNDGYGNYIIIEHPNETATRYAHTQENFVARGEYVLQGDRIALVGNSGNVHGPTGCHLHFEVDGAHNPFVIR